MMKTKYFFLVALLFLACQSPKEEARKPLENNKETTPLQPISEEDIAHAVLYEANIRQYSEEGTFNAFA
ncbi:MAG: hypothetical protein ACO39G_07370 [Flavobacteriaceae bacterium]